MYINAGIQIFSVSNFSLSSASSKFFTNLKRIFFTVLLVTNFVTDLLETIRAKQHTRSLKLSCTNTPTEENTSSSSRRKRAYRMSNGTLDYYRNPETLPRLLNCKNNDAEMLKYLRGHFRATNVLRAVLSSSRRKPGFLARSNHPFPIVRERVKMVKTRSKMKDFRRPRRYGPEGNNL